MAAADILFQYRGATMTLTRPLHFFVFCLFITLTGCAGGAVVFAPTEAPPDVSPLRYQHPSGTFQLNVPRRWAVHEQNTTTLASAAFSRPGEDSPVVMVSVVSPIASDDSQAFAQLIQQYQTQVRADVERYTEQNRQAMGDGSWRMTGLRRTATGETQQVNTFIQRNDSLFAIMDVIVSDASGWDELQGIVNSFSLNREAALQPAPLTTLNSAGATALAVLHVSTWQTRDGVFFVTGEVANTGAEPALGLPVVVTLRSPDGLNVGEATDTVMGHGIPPGGFAPFSLRFGQGQPALASTYEIRLGDGWTPGADAVLAPSDTLSWTDESAYADGLLTISGTVTNASDRLVRAPLAVATVFDAAQNVIAGGYAPAETDALAPGESARFVVGIPEIGGTPANYILYVQGLAD
jgi:hypothetical protein